MLRPSHLSVSSNRLEFFVYGLVKLTEQRGQGQDVMTEERYANHLQRPLLQHIINSILTVREKSCEVNRLRGTLLTSTST